MLTLKISAIPWLNCGSSEDAKGSQSDTRKRWEMFYEFMYYIFDSLIIPLIRCNFHVTESGVHRYRIFYFRQDVWRNLAEPAMASLKQAMFEEVDMNVAKSVLDSRTIGFSQIRLLPKEKGVRPVLNLRRRQVRRDSKRALGPSINSTLAPVYNMLTFEKVCASNLRLADTNTGRTYRPQSSVLLSSLSATCTIKSRSLRKQSNL